MYEHLTGLLWKQINIPPLSRRTTNFWIGLSIIEGLKLSPFSLLVSYLPLGPWPAEPNHQFLLWFPPHVLVAIGFLVACRLWWWLRRWLLFSSVVHSTSALWKIPLSTLFFTSSRTVQWGTALSATSLQHTNPALQTFQVVVTQHWTSSKLGGWLEASQRLWCHGVIYSIHS